MKKSQAGTRRVYGKYSSADWPKKKGQETAGVFFDQGFVRSFVCDDRDSVGSGAPCKQGLIQFVSSRKIRAAGYSQTPLLLQRCCPTNMSPHWKDRIPELIPVASVNQKNISRSTPKHLLLPLVRLPGGPIGLLCNLASGDIDIVDPLSSPSLLAPLLEHRYLTT